MYACRCEEAYMKHTGGSASDDAYISIIFACEKEVWCLQWAYGAANGATRMVELIFRSYNEYPDIEHRQLEKS